MTFVYLKVGLFFVSNVKYVLKASVNIQLFRQLSLHKASKLRFEDK